MSETTEARELHHELERYNSGFMTQKQVAMAEWQRLLIQVAFNVVFCVTKKSLVEGKGRLKFLDEEFLSTKSEQKREDHLSL